MWRPAEEGQRAQESARAGDGGHGGGRHWGGDGVDGGCGWIDVDDGVFGGHDEVVGLVAVGRILEDVWVGLLRAVCVVGLVDVTVVVPVVVSWFGEGCEADPARRGRTMVVGRRRGRRRGCR